MDFEAKLLLLLNDDNCFELEKFSMYLMKRMHYVADNHETETCAICIVCNRSKLFHNFFLKKIKINKTLISSYIKK